MVISSLQKIQFFCNNNTNLADADDDEPEAEVRTARVAPAWRYDLGIC